VDEQPQILTGGNSNIVVKQGATVLRNTGAWSPFIHSLLQYLTTNGFTESPMLLEATETQERLSFIEGEVGHYPLKPYMRSDEIVMEAAELLRRYHDLTQHVVVPAGAVFQHAVHQGEPYEVICHNDFAPYNCVFRNNHLVGLIDFDVASPGTRLWDIAYAVYRYAPLANDAHCADQGWAQPPDRAYRLKLFCDAYGLGDRAPLVETVIHRLERLVAYMQVTSSNLEHIPIYLADIAYIRDNQPHFMDALAG
jgi:thiamine kinase-like enzyme